MSENEFDHSVICGREEKHPNDWETTRFDDICRKVKRGASPRPIGDDKWFGGDVGWIRIRDVTGENKYLKETEEYLSEEGVDESVRVYPQEVLMSIAGTVAEPTILDMDACIHDGLVCFKDLEPDVSPEFLYYYITRFDNHIESIGMTGTQTNLNSSVVGDIPFLKPELSEQRRIASVLYSVDEQLRTLTDRHDRLSELKHGLMQDLLTGETRVTPDIDVHEDVESDVEVNQDEDWKRASFENLDARFESGLSYDGNDEVKEPTENSIPVAGTGAVKNQNIIEDELAHIENVSEEKIEELSLSEGDVLMVAASGSDERLGETVTVDSSMDCLFGTFVTRIRVENLNTHYLGYYLNSNMVQSRLDGLARGSTSLNNLNKADLKLMDIDVPPLWEQERIASVLYTVDEMIARTSDLIDEYERLKRGLMQDLLSGDVRTPEDLEVLDEIKDS